MRKRILATVLALCLVLGLVPGTAWAAEEAEKRYDLGEVKCEGGYEPAYLTYEDNMQGGITITGVFPANNYALHIGVVPGSLDLIIPESIEGKSVTSIGPWAFHTCHWATNVLKIPDTVTTISDSAFTSCPISGVILPSQLTTIEDGAFLGNTLEKFEIETGNPNFTVVDGVLFNGDLTRLICYPGAKKEENYQIPDGVTHIADEAFCSCQNLTCLTIPSSVKSIADSTGYNRAAFDTNDKLDKFNVAEENPYFSTVDGVLYNSDQTALILYPRAKEGHSYSIPDGTTRIESAAFEGAANLDSIFVPASVTSIGDYAFDGASTEHRVTDVYYAGSETEFYEMISSEYLDSLTVRYYKITFHFDAEIPEEPPVKPSTYTITFNANGGTVSFPTAVTDTNGKLTTLPTPIRKGYTFDGWYTSLEGGNTVDVSNIYTADTVLYAHWVVEEVPPVNPPAYEDTYYISISRSDNGSIIPTARNAAPGDRVTLYAHPDAGYALDTLTVKDIRGRSITLRSLGGNAYSFLMPSARVTVDASFVKTQADAPVSTPAEDETFTGLGTPGISGIVLNPAVMPFTDVKSTDWFYNNVDYVWKHYLMGGVSDTRFAPNATTNRAMVWTILARMNNVRTDINPGSTWYEKGLLWAKEQGVTDGTDPLGDITREQLAAMLWRSAGRPAPGAAADLSRFSDGGAVSEYAQTAVRWAASTGILNGSNGQLNPQDTATRAQIAAMVQRYGERIGA